MTSSASQRVIDAFYGMSSPWAYLGAARLAEIAARHAVTVRLRPIRIIEDNGGIPLRTRPLARQAYHEVELIRWRHFLHIPLNLKPRHYPCRTIEPAARLVIAAQNAGKDASALSYAIQRGLWAEERDIADPATLDQIWHDTLGGSRQAEIDDQTVAAAQAEWEHNLREAEQIGIFGTPTYVVDEQLFWGQDRLDFVDRYLASAQPASAQGRI